jgi:1-acyl-sn-glycerol-3-phosphate acyltransferase
VTLLRVVRFMLYLFFRIFHAIQYRGTRNVPKTGPVLIAGNHPSYLDPLVVGLGTERLVRFFALKEILEAPVVGWLARQWGTLPVVPRGDNEPTVEKAIRILKRGGAIGIFPEGRRSFQSVMGPVKPGVGRLAGRSGAPVVPCVIYGTWKAWPHRTGLPHPAKIVVEFAEIAGGLRPPQFLRIGKRGRPSITHER